MTNQHKKGNLKIIKVDKDDTDITIGGIEFDLYNEEKELVSHVVTDADGEAFIENINTGNYTLQETRTKKEYKLCIDQNLIVKWNETSVFTIENEKKKGKIKISKVDKDHHEIKLSGVEFEILDKNNRIVEKVTTNQEGEAITSLLPLGIYHVKEVSLGANYEYLLNDSLFTVSLEEDQQIYPLVIENEHKKGKLKIVKIDKDNHSIPLKNVEFKVTDDTGFSCKVYTDINGIAEIPNIRTGIITIQEMKTKEEYVLNKTKYTVDIKANKTSEITIENEMKKGQIQVYKVDKDNHEIKLKNVEFTIFNSEGQMVETLTTDENGYAISKRLPIGEYLIKETKTNHSYVLQEELIRVEIQQDEISTLQLTNEKKKGKIKILKISSKESPILKNKKGTRLSGISFGIYDKNNQLVDTVVTNEKGEAISKDLEIGRYCIKEISTIPYYLLNEEKRFVTIEYHQETKTITVENEPAIPDLEIEKTGPKQAEKDKEIEYLFMIKNTGNTSLDHFTWIEKIPYEQLKITKMITGIYNVDSKYQLYYKTNQRDYQFFKEVSTSQNEYLDFTTINLQKNEQITEIKVDFGSVPIGFKSNETPKLIAKIKQQVKIGEKIENKTYLSGEFEGYPIQEEDATITEVQETNIQKKLPRTGK